MKLFAYGSLMNQSSLAGQLGRPTALTPSLLWGFRRVFNAPFDEYAYLNLEQSPGACVSGAVFELNEQEIELFRDREAGSCLTEVSAGCFAFIWPDRACRELPVVQSYLDLCEAGANALQINFWAYTRRPRVIINDRHSPIYVSTGALVDF